MCSLRWRRNPQTLHGAPIISNSHIRLIWAHEPGRLFSAARPFLELGRSNGDLAII
jgi:hypothetical protein